MLLNCREKQSSAHQEATEGKTALGTALVVVLLILSAALARGQSETPQSPVAAQHSPLLLIDEVEHLPVLASKAIPLSLPHGGVVNIDVEVVRGNSIDVFLTTADQIGSGKEVEWNNLKIYGDLKATGTKKFSRDVRLGQGGFYLVVRDMTVGTPSTPPTDIAVKVHLNP